MALNEAELNLIKYLGISEADFGNMSQTELKKKTTEKLVKIMEDRNFGERQECLDNAQNAVPKINECLKNSVLVHYRKKAAKGGKVTYPVGKIIGYSDGEYLVISPSVKSEKDKSAAKTKRPTIIYVAENDVIAKAEDMR